MQKTHDTGFRKSRLPTLTAEEINYIRGTFDFLGLNSYTTRIVEHRECPQNEETTGKYKIGGPQTSVNLLTSLT